MTHYTEALGEALTPLRKKKTAPAGLAESVVHHLGEDMVRPLKKGYVHLEAFLAPYIRALETGQVTTPTLAASLRWIAAQPDLKPHLQRLPGNARCLMLGYSTPDNEEALRSFLGAYGIDGAKLHAVDLYNLKAVYRKLNLPLPRLKYHVADATALPKIFESAFDLVIQDFLLNCVPHADQVRVLSETVRSLSEEGLALIHFTDASGVARLPRKTIQALWDEHALRWQRTAYQLSDINGTAGRESALLARVGGKVIVDEQPHQFTYVTSVDGHFEFFTDAPRIFLMFAEAGLTLASQTSSQGIDYHQLCCRRHYCLLRKRRLSRPD